MIMADIFTPEERSRIMSRIRDRNTKPELIVRRMVHRMGYRYRLHKKDLPGKPDIVLSKYRKVIFVHGCFWHVHTSCSHFTLPKTNSEFWMEKLKQNVERDERNIKRLEEMGWKALVVWECETKHPEKLLEKLQVFLCDEFSGR